jgi:hypothetical protein
MSVSEINGKDEIKASLMSVYIKPRKRIDNETKKYALSRRLEEFIEFEQATTNFSNMLFHEELLAYIEEVDAPIGGNGDDSMLQQDVGIYKEFNHNACDNT